MSWTLTSICILTLSLLGVTNQFILKLDKNPDITINSEELKNILSSIDFNNMETEALNQLHLEHMKATNKMKREALNQTDIQSASENKMDKHPLSGYEDIKDDIEKTASDTSCTYNACVKLCKVIYYDWPQHLAQCIDSDCFCFRKDLELFPPGLKEFLKNGKTLFGIRQFYD